MGKCGKMRGDMGNVCSRNLATDFVSKFSARIILPFLPTILKQQQKAIVCVLPTVGVGRCGKMLKKVERCGDRLPIKLYELV